MSRVRINIEIEDLYVNVIMDRFGVRTKTEAVDPAPCQMTAACVSHDLGGHVGVG
jgi:Arc/MetJ family transcription regulator